MASDDLNRAAHRIAREIRKALNLSIFETRRIVPIILEGLGDEGPYDERVKELSPMDVYNYTDPNASLATQDLFIDQVVRHIRGKMHAGQSFFVAIVPPRVWDKPSFDAPTEADGK